MFGQKGTGLGEAPREAGTAGTKAERKENQHKTHERRTPCQSLPCRLGPGLDSKGFRLERSGLTAVGIDQKRRGGDVVQVGGDGA